jgi:hypothetical protein
MVADNQGIGDEGRVTAAAGMGQNRPPGSALVCLLPPGADMVLEKGPVGQAAPFRFRLRAYVVANLAGPVERGASGALSWRPGGRARGRLAEEIAQSRGRLARLAVGPVAVNRLSEPKAGLTDRQVCFR